MLLVYLVGKLKPSSQFNQSPQPFLLKKYWNASSYLPITYQKIIDFYYLLCINKICYVPIFINSSIKISGACFFIWSFGYENVGNFGSLNKYLKTVDITLNDRNAPLFLNLIFLKFDKKTLIPSEFVFGFHLLML